MSVSTETFVVNAGWFVRKAAINAITGAAWEKGLDCQHEVAGRSIRFTVKGDKRKIQLFLRIVAIALPEEGQ